MELAGFQGDKRKRKELKNEEAEKKSRQTKRRASERETGKFRKALNIEPKLPKIRLISMTYHLLVSMTAAVTFGK